MLRHQSSFWDCLALIKPKHWDLQEFGGSFHRFPLSFWGCHLYGLWVTKRPKIFVPTQRKNMILNLIKAKQSQNPNLKSHRLCYNHLH